MSRWKWLACSTSAVTIWAASGFAQEAGPPPARTFDHKQHAELDEPAVTPDNCGDCHGRDPAGNLAVPAKLGHKPCLNSGCHVEDFLMMSPAGKQRDAKRYAQAASFCLGCHSSVPRRFLSAKADSPNRTTRPRDHYTEMNHFQHTRRGDCRGCHVVDRQSHEFDATAPGHTQCAGCHGKKEHEDAPPMYECTNCHQPGAPEVYFDQQRVRSEVRTCGSEGHLRLAAKTGRQPGETPCFKHETEAHRQDKDGSVLQCDACHFMIPTKSRWSGNHRYQSLRDVKRAPVIHNKRDLAHRSCGKAGGCHRKDVADRRGTSRCVLCHSRRTIDKGLFE